MKYPTLLILAVVLGAGTLLAQRGRRGGGEGWISEDAPVRTAREVETHSNDFPRWDNPAGFEHDVFTFTRIRYSRDPRSRFGCFTDFPDSDLDLSYRLQQLTALKVDPDGRVLRLTDPELFEFPWIYMVEPGSLMLDEAEATSLRRYLLNGGFLMADDFWGERQWEMFADQMKQVLPDHQFIDLSMDHPVFQGIFDLGRSMNGLQTPNYQTGESSQYTGVTWEEFHGSDTRDVHIRAIFDERSRMMVIACHNTDNGDGWEREQEYAYFFREFSEKRAYPLGINIIFYAMTH